MAEEGGRGREKWKVEWLLQDTWVREDRRGDKRGADEPREARTVKSWEQEVDAPEVIWVPTRGVCRTVRGDRPSRRDNIERGFTFAERGVWRTVTPASSRLVLRVGDLKRHREQLHNTAAFPLSANNVDSASPQRHSIVFFIVYLTVVLWSFTGFFFRPGVFITFPQLGTQLWSVTRRCKTVRENVNVSAENVSLIKRFELGVK